MAGLAGLAGCKGWVAGVFGAGLATVQAAILRPNGVAFSPHTARLAVVLVVAAAACGAWGALRERRRAGAGPGRSGHC